MANSRSDLGLFKVRRRYFGVKRVLLVLFSVLFSIQLFLFVEIEKRGGFDG